MNIINYVGFINESFESKKIKGILSYITGDVNKRNFLYSLKDECKKNDILVSDVSDDSFEYLSVIDFVDELNDKGDRISFPCIVFLFSSKGNIQSCFKLSKYDNFTASSIQADFCLVLNLDKVKDSSKGLNDLLDIRKKRKESPKTKDIFDIMGNRDPLDLPRVSKQLKRLFGGSYPLFYISHMRAHFRGTKNNIEIGYNLNHQGILRDIHNFNIKIINFLTRTKGSETVEKIMEINEVIKNKIDRFTIEDYDDCESFVWYLSTILEILDSHDILWIIRDITDFRDPDHDCYYSIDYFDVALKIIKKI
jgi:hypothetical protein